MIRNKSNNENFAITILIMLSICIILLTALFVFDLSDFTGFAVDGKNLNNDILTNLVIIDDADTEIKAFNEEVKFYANYININTGNAIENALCKIYFDDSNASMQFNTVSQSYEYTKIFSDRGLYNWNVTCSKAGFTILTENDVVIIGSISSISREEIFSTVCIEEWACTDWGPCLLNGIHNRECFDLNKCDELHDKKFILHIERSVKPFSIGSCIYQPTCGDMIMNNDESDVDCGGPCAKCEDGKICRNDNDCVNKCDLAKRRCYIEEVVPAEIFEPRLELPSKKRLIQILIFGFLIMILLIVIFTTYRYELIHKGVEYYRGKVPETRGIEEKQIKEVEERKVHEKERKRYTEQLDEFFTKAVEKGYDFDKVKNMLISKGWSGRIVDGYFDIFDAKKQKLIFGVGKKTLEKKGAHEKAIKEIKKKEDELQETLDHLEKKLSDNSDYLKNELPKKWLVEIPVRKEKKTVKKPDKKPKKIDISKELDRLQEVADYFEAELGENIDHFKKREPMRLVSSSELNKLIEERRQVLQDIKKTEEELDSLQKLRFELEKKEIGIDTKKTIEKLKRVEDRIKDKLNQIKK